MAGRSSVTEWLTPLRRPTSNLFSDRMLVALVSREPTPTTLGLASARPCRAELVPMTPFEALRRLGPGDAALGRLDVRPTLDGVDDGLWALGVLEARGVTVLNGTGALLAAHDKLLTARILRRAGLPHPRTTVVRGTRTEVSLEPPVVVKPRHGSWGRSVTRYETTEELTAELGRIRAEPWYVTHGALVQQLVPSQGHDLRLIVAGERVVGCVRRMAAPGEWRTNVALGARRFEAQAPPAAIRIALAAARAVGTTLVGVDMLPTPDGFTILEVNGAVEFTRDYRRGEDVFGEAAEEIVKAVHDAVEPQAEPLAV
jgi:[lysine-biosynthesis-protein LysW]---L-2-aminoadipate ligase